MARQILEDLVPNLAQVRARERRNRALAFARLTRTVCGLELRALTPADRLDLQNLSNAFTVPGVEPLEGDVFVFLWILHPKRNRKPGIVGALVNNVRQSQLRRYVKRLDLGQAKRAIRLFLLEQLQDLPEGSAESAIDQSPWVHWIAADASFWMNKHGGFTLDEFLRTPYLVLQQLYRGYRCNNPVMHVGKTGEVVVDEPQFINASDRLIGEWHAQHKAAVVARITAQRERLN